MSKGKSIWGKKLANNSTRAGSDSPICSYKLIQCFYLKKKKNYDIIISHITRIIIINQHFSLSR